MMIPAGTQWPRGAMRGGQAMPNPPIPLAIRRLRGHPAPPTADAETGN